LGVNAVLQGTIAAEESAGLGRRIRVTAKLLAAGTGAELWSGSFDAAPGEIAEMETSLAKSIAHGIRLAVSPREADRLRTGGARTSPQAEEAYFQGRYQLMQYGVDSARRALVAFERAISIDPRHAAAHAALARTYVTLGFNGALSQPEARARALAVSSRAIELDSESSEVQLALADLAFYYDWDWKRADAFYKRAIELGPSAAYARSQYARYLAAAGRVKEAIDQAVQAEALDPLSPDAAQTEGLMRYYARDYGGAERALQHAIEIDPAYARAHYVLGRVREAQGRVTDAVTVTDHAFSLSREPGSNWLAQLSRLHALAGEHALARREVEDLARGALRSHPENLAYTYLALGEPGRAMALLEQAAAERDPSLLWLRVDPRVDPLRGTPRFDALLERLGTP
jgi:tetratricopeptide (TPR) repeat protein